MLDSSIMETVVYGLMEKKKTINTTHAPRPICSLWSVCIRDRQHHFKLNPDQPSAAEKQDSVMSGRWKEIL